MKVFVLKRKRTFKRSIRLFVKNPKGELTAAKVMFTSEHLARADQRGVGKRSAKVQAEYRTADPFVIEALYASAGYGKTFYEKGDEEGAKKKRSYDLKVEDAEKIALRNHFEVAGLAFDESKPLPVLKEELLIQHQLKVGAKPQENAPLPIKEEQIDVKADLQSAQKESLINAKDKYFAMYNEELPAEYYNDLAMLDGLQTNDFDPKAYISQKEDKAKEEKVETTDEKKARLHKKYMEVKGEKVPNNKSNDFEWIENAIG